MGYLGYGIAIGAELIAAALLIWAGLRRRPVDQTLLSLGLMAPLAAGATIVACAPPRGAQNISFVAASSSAFVPSVWVGGQARRKDAVENTAWAFLVLAALFACVLYDSLVANGTIDTFYIQPFIGPALVTVVAIRTLGATLTVERALIELRSVGFATRLVESAADLPGALKPVVALVGPLVGAEAMTAAIAEPAGRHRFDWYAPSSDRTRMRAALKHAARVVGTGTAPLRTSLRLAGVADHTVAVMPLISLGAHLGDVFFVIRAPPRKVRSRQRLIELIAGEIAALVRRSRHLEQLKLNATADERYRIARELHDSVSQTLYTIAMMADTLPNTVERDPGAAIDQVRQVRSMTLDALGEIRALLFEMRRSALESASLGGLLEQLGESPIGRATVDISVTGLVDLPADVKLAAYRIAQEAVVNADRHGSADSIRVRLEQRYGDVTMSIEDDGSGFDPGNSTRGGHGLQIMRERAENIGAELTIDSTFGRGTRVRLVWHRRV